MSDVVRVGLWSGPRNISTAMMRAFENRPDTVVIDEPLYAAYLARTGVDHPVREQVIASQPTDLDAVQKALAAMNWKISSAALIWVAKNPVHLEPAAKAEVEQFLAELDEDDDVQHIFVGLA